MPLPPPRTQVCDSLNDLLRPVAYQAVPLLVGILSRPGSEGAKQAAARAISNLVCSDAAVQVRGGTGGRQARAGAGQAATCAALQSVRAH